MELNSPGGVHGGMPVSPMVSIWSGRDDFDRCVADAIALTKPLGESAPVVDIFSREVIR